MLIHALAYVRESPRTRGLIEQIPPNIVQHAETVKLAEWCDARYAIDVFRCIANHAGGDEALARELLIEAGQSISKTAANTFLRLLMKMLTPTVFAKKMPDFWRRDSTMGTLEVEIEDQRLTVYMVDMDSFDHVACTTAGFVKNAFEGMGKKIVKIETPDWSFATPYVPRSKLILTWTN
jgi:hypothetical protein